MLGHGRVSNHEGLFEAELRRPSHRSFHRTPLNEAEEAQGLTRFYRWQAFYERNLMRPAIAPERVYAHAWSQGDLVIFNNRGVWHSAVGSLSASDLRVYRRCNLASPEAPVRAT